MKNILVISLILLGMSAFGQTTKKQPYIFDNYVTLNDSLKIGASSNMFQYGEFLRVDTLSNGSPFISTRAVSTTISYDSVTARPFTQVSNGFRTLDTASLGKLEVGGKNDTITSSAYFKLGVTLGVYNMSDGETILDGNNGSIFQISVNSAPTTINAFNLEQGRVVYILGRTSANTTQITSTSSIILTGADPITLDNNKVITFISTLDAGGNQILLEINRN